VDSGRDRLWLRWTQDGRVFAEGSLAAGFDKVVWQLPVREGAYTVRVDFYPGPPSSNSFSIASPWSESMTMMARRDKANRPADPFDSSSRFETLFTFDGDLSDSGTRVQSSAVQLLGPPELTTYPGGFGYRIGTDAGIRAKQLGLDTKREGGAFSILLRASVESSSGNLLVLSGDSAALSLTVGFDEKGLYAEFKKDGLAAKSRPGRILDKGPHDVMVSFIPGDGFASVLWTIDGKRYPSPHLSLVGPLFSELDLGGQGSATAIYDAIGVTLDGGNGPPALFASSIYRMTGDSLVVAEGFESEPGKGLVLRGSGTASAFSYSLDSGSSIALGDLLASNKAISIETAWHDGSLRLEAEDRYGSQLFAVGSDGSVVDTGGRVLGTLQATTHQAGLTLSQVDGAWGLSNLDGAKVTLGFDLPKNIRIVLFADSAVSIDSLVVRQASKAGTSGIQG
jgi:hypothetical protein